MKKTLLSACVLAACSAAAQAQTNVTVYGLVDVGIIHESGRTDGRKVTELGSGIQSGSRLGFRGTEDLGGGLSAIFAIESGFQPDTGVMGQGGVMWGRQAWVGLQGGFGVAKFGRQYTPVDVLLGQIDPFSNLTTGKVGNLLVREYAARSDNAIMYATPNFGGFTADLMYGFGEVAGDNSANRFVGVSAGYAAGPLTIRLAYQDRNPTTPATATATGLENLVLGAKYNFGVATVSLLYAKSEQTTGTTTSVDADDASLGVSVPLGTGTLMASFTRRDDNLATNRDVNMYSLGYTHPLSKRTNLYTSYGHIKNRLGTAYTVSGATEGGSGGRALAVGLRHSF